MSDPIFYGKPLTFNEKAHRYYWDGKPVPSVTTILRRLDKPALIQWAADCAAEYFEREVDANPDRVGSTVLAAIREEARVAHTQIRDAAGDVGKALHEWARARLAGETPTMRMPLGADPTQVGRTVHAFEEWVGQHIIQPIAVERRVFSRNHLYAGTCDFYGHIDGTLGVLDFKTGNGVYDEAWWQTSGYEAALHEELGCGSLARWVVHLNKNTGECVAHVRNTVEDTLQDAAVWHCLLKLDASLRVARKHPQPKRKAA